MRQRVKSVPDDNLVLFQLRWKDTMLKDEKTLNYFERGFWKKDSTIQNTATTIGAATNIGAREKLFRGEGGGSRANIARKNLVRKNMLMIRSTINILPLVFTYFVICLRNKKMSLWFWKQISFTFLCKTISTYWYTTNQGIQIHYTWLD